MLATSRGMTAVNTKFEYSLTLQTSMETRGSLTLVKDSVAMFSDSQKRDCLFADIGQAKLSPGRCQRDGQKVRHA